MKAFAIAAAVILVASVVFLGMRRSLPETVVPHFRPAVLPQSTVKVPTSGTDVSVQQLEARLAEETQARAKAEAEADALRKSIAPMQGQVVVTLGKVEDIGKRTGAILPALAEMLALLERDPATLSADEKRRLLNLQRQHAEVLGMLPEIAGFQDRPEEYGKFFRNMIQQSASLADAQGDSIESYMRQRAQTMNQLGLNTAREPQDAQLEAAWEARRDVFNEETVTGLQNLLPPGAAGKAGISPELMEFLEMDFDKMATSRLAKP
ncbi:MAG TPA: hypothetical protein DDZ88_15510 [Verrucomicrobiales bacterium]|nr:hypothetical protein [Verrucomicrobiales bacterium]